MPGFLAASLALPLGPLRAGVGLANHIKTKVQEHKEYVAGLEEVVERTNKELDNLLYDHTDLTAHFDVTSQSEETLLAFNDELQKDRYLYKTEASQLLRDKLALLYTCNQQQKDKTGLEALCADLQARLSTAEQQVHSSEQQVETANARLTATSATIAHVQDARTASDGQLHITQQQLQAALQTIVAKDAVAEQLQQLESATRQQLAGTQQELSRSADQLQACQHTVGTKDLEISQLQETVEQLEAEQRLSQRTAEQQDSEIQELGRQLQDTQAQLSAAVEDTDKQLVAFKQALAAQTSRYRQLKQIAVDAEKALSLETQQLEDAQAEMELMEGQEQRHNTNMALTRLQCFGAIVGGRTTKRLLLQCRPHARFPIGDFVDGVPLGAGACNAVCQVAYKNPDDSFQSVALKYIQAEEESLEAERSSLAQERLVFTGLGAHPCLVTCYGHATGRPQPKPQLVALVLEWLPGGDLHSMLLAFDGQERVPLEIVHLFASCLAQALAHMHARHFLHCDVKPANILLSQCVEPGQPVDATTLTFKLTDLGLALDQSAPQPTTFMGTGRYAAEDHLRAEYSPAIDVFGFGACLFEMLTGQRFRDHIHCDNTAFEAAAQAGTGELELGPEQQAAVAALPLWWQTFLRATLQRYPKQRPSMSALVQLLSDPSCPGYADHTHLGSTERSLIATPTPQSGLATIPEEDTTGSPEQQQHSRAMTPAAAPRPVVPALNLARLASPPQDSPRLTSSERLRRLPALSPRQSPTPDTLLPSGLFSDRSLKLELFSDRSLHLPMAVPSTDAAPSPAKQPCSAHAPNYASSSTSSSTSSKSAHVQMPAFQTLPGNAMPGQSAAAAAAVSAAPTGL